MSNEVVISNINDLVRRYESGETLQKLAKEIGVSRSALGRRFHKLGIAVRGCGDAQLVSNRFKSLEQRRSQVRAANTARRGSQASQQELINRAKGRQGTSGNV